MGKLRVSDIPIIYMLHLLCYQVTKKYLAYSPFCTLTICYNTLSNREGLDTTACHIDAWSYC